MAQQDMTMDAEDSVNNARDLLLEKPVTAGDWKLRNLLVPSWWDKDDEKLGRLEMVFEHKDQPHRLDRQIQKNEPNKIKVKVFDIIHSDTREPYTSGTQKLKCQVLRIPSDIPGPSDTHIHKNRQDSAVGGVIFVKVFDPMLFPRHISFIDTQWTITARADMALSNEVGAYEYLHQKYLTGSPYIASQWVGCWTAEVATTDPSYKGRTRHVVVVVLEYIDGICLQKVLRINEVDELVYVGDRVSVGEDVQKLRGYQVNLNLTQIYPEKVMVSFPKRPDESKGLRVSLVGYKDCSIGPLQELPKRERPGRPRAAKISRSQASLLSRRETLDEMLEKFSENMLVESE
ncbi:hypothetical protein LX36DRAFT_712265 [Colletotrichum falcatum]|nr:hypothetical protein LX36DRAFT_712265 [Colletotrichum falcatum]